MTQNIVATVKGYIYGIPEGTMAKFNVWAVKKLSGSIKRSSGII